MAFDYKNTLENALRYERYTGQKAAIIKTSKGYSFCNKENVKKIKDLKLYTTTNGVEIEIKTRKRRQKNKENE